MQYFIVNSFTDRAFTGNPAGVCVLDGPMPETLMQQIATENNMSETAFFYRDGEIYQLRWFTPAAEIDLCGHATLASAFVVFNFLDLKADKVVFSTASGLLEVFKREDALEMVFPLRIAKPIEVTDTMVECLGFQPVEVLSARDLIVVMESLEDVANYKADMDKLRKLEQWLGIVVTAKGKDCDFVSRFFCPEINVEDPVTGSSHCNLVPYWAERLGKKEMIARQLSQRGGILECVLDGDKVRLIGKAVLYVRGEMFV